MLWLLGALGRTEVDRIVSGVTLGFLAAELREHPADLAGLFSKYGNLTVSDTDE